MAATIPVAWVSTARAAAKMAMTIAIEVAENINDFRRPILSIPYQVPKEATKNQICRNPDIRRARWWGRPTESSKLYARKENIQISQHGNTERCSRKLNVHYGCVITDWGATTPSLASI